MASISPSSFLARSCRKPNLGVSNDLPFSHLHVWHSRRENRAFRVMIPVQDPVQEPGVSDFRSKCLMTILSEMAKGNIAQMAMTSLLILEPVLNLQIPFDLSAELLATSCCATGEVPSALHEVHDVRGAMGCRNGSWTSECLAMWRCGDVGCDACTTSYQFRENNCNSASIWEIESVLNRILASRVGWTTANLRLCSLRCAHCCHLPAATNPTAKWT